MSAAAALRLPARRPGALVPLAAAVCAVGATTLMSAAVTFAPGLLRLGFALAIALALIVACLGRPQTGVAVALVYFTALTFLRRILIGPAGWTSFDPLLLVGPIVLALLLVRLFTLERRPLAPDVLSKLMLVVVAFSVLEIPNPVGGGVPAGLGGALLVLVPLLWFFVGREYVDERLARRLLGGLVLVGLVEAVYGLVQTQIGFPQWDLDWFLVNGYSSLNVGDNLRAFGTFSSAAEYALYVGAAAAPTVGLASKGSTRYLLPLPVLALGLFYSSNRSALITTALAAIVTLSLIPRRARLALLVGLAGLALAVGALTAFGSQLSQSADQSGNDLVSHQVNGVTDPLNPQSSTLIVHFTLVIEGIKQGITQPFGRGTGATSQAGSKFSARGGQDATEVDLSNAFVNLGLVGGFAYLALVLLTLRRAFQAYLRGSDVMLGVIGLLIVALGQWGTGGLYAMGPVVWLAAGFVAATTRRQGLERATALPAAAPAAAVPA